MIGRSSSLAVPLAETRAAKRSTWTSAQWHEYFRRNAGNLMRISWELGVNFAPDERAAIEASIQQFQLGESSDGRRFMAMGFDHAAATGDRGYPAALRRLIAEEQRHGRDLGRVMELAGIPTIRRCWADTLFRWLRHTSGLERSIYVLVTAEIIAQVYYDALRDATGSIVLRQLCTQILRDEDEHVRFQCERLAILRRPKRWPSVTIKHGFYRVFFIGVGLAFWSKHSAVMRAGGYGFFGFWKAVWRKLRTAIHLMNPKRYDWPLRSTGVPPVTSFGSSVTKPDDFDLHGSWLEL